jgi:hypothetical protein
VELSAALFRVSELKAPLSPLTYYIWLLTEITVAVYRRVIRRTPGGEQTRLRWLTVERDLDSKRINYNQSRAVAKERW